MSLIGPPMRFAVLVGVDLYQSDGSRNWNKGEPVTLRQLHGCVNDVQAISHVLQHKFGVTNPRIFTASAMPNMAAPREPASSLPTFENIQSQYVNILHEAQAGDLFFFYFSGHGAKLPVISASPRDGRTDPSLMTIDYCCGKPAVRGWQLNQWLKSLHQNAIQIIVILDSCYSGGAWRNNDDKNDISTRTPKQWNEIPPTLPADEVTAEIAEEAANRDNRIPHIWGIDPEGFTLMTAGSVNESVQEKLFPSQVWRGVFTNQLLLSLEQLRPSLPIYRVLRDHIDISVERQTPQVFGRDRLIFFGDSEPFSPTPMLVRVENGLVIVPLGHIHGIQPGTEFITCSPTQLYTIRVDWVGTTICSQQVSPDVERYFIANNEVILSRPCVDKGLFRIHLNPSMPIPIRQLLKRYIGYKVAGKIQYIERLHSFDTVQSSKKSGA